MARFITFLVLLVLTATNVLAQDCRYGEYFSLTKEARQLYNTKKYKDAGMAFKTAFSTVDFPLGVDLALALKTAKKLEDEKWAEIVSIQLAKGGIPLKFFDHLQKFKWYTKFRDDFSNYEQHYKENFNADLRQKLLDAKRVDQEWNEQFHKWRVRAIELTEEELLIGFSHNLNAFEAIFKEYGFPSEQVMGYYYSRKQVAEYPTGVLLTHIYQGGVLLYFNELNVLACQGYITPDYVDILKSVRGFGDSTGVEQEVKARIKKFRKEKN